MRQSRTSGVVRVIAGFLLLVAVGVVDGEAQTPSFPSTPHEQIWNLLTVEIARDRELTSHGINRARVKEVQEALEPDLEKKRLLVDDIGGAPDPLIKRIVAMLKETLEDETRIVEGGRNHRSRRFAERSLNANLAKKEAALQELKKSISGH